MTSELHVRRNPLTGAQVLVTLVLLGVGATGYVMGAQTAAGPQPGDQCAPYMYRPDAVQRRVSYYLDRGDTDPALVAINAATDLFGDHPSEGAVVFPPGDDARPEVRCVFDRVLAQVDDTFRARGLDADDVPNPAPGVVWRTVSAAPGSRDLAHYPWQAPVLREEGIPTPGTFVVANPDSDPGAFYKDATASALALAGLDPELAYDNNSKIGKRLRREMRDAVLTHPFNDGRLTASGAGPAHVLGPHGRGIVWGRVHYDDLSRLAVGHPAKRNVRLDGSVIGSGRSAPLVYVPAIHLGELRSMTPRITTDGTGTSIPVAVARLGIDTSGVELVRRAS